MDSEPEMDVLVIATIRKIEREALTSGLTNRVKEFMEKSLKELGREVPKLNN